MTPSSPRMSTVVAESTQTIRALWQAALRQPLLLFGVPTAIAIISIVAVLLVNRRYRADVSFIYESSTPMELPSAVLGLVSQLNLGRLKPSESPQFYVTLLTSRPVLNELLLLQPRHSCKAPAGTRVLEILKIDGDSREDSLYYGRLALHSTMEIDFDSRTSIVNVSIEAPCPRLAAELADSLVAGLNRFNIRARQFTAKNRRIFAEGRVAEADSSLRAAENALEGFLKRNRRFESPELQFQANRLQRRVDHWQEVSTGLQREYESARIEEVNSTPVVTIVEPPEVPARPSWPRSRLIVILATAFATIIGAAFAIGRTLKHPLPAEAPAELQTLHAWAGLVGNGQVPAHPPDRRAVRPTGRAV